MRKTTFVNPLCRSVNLLCFVVLILVSAPAFCQNEPPAAAMPSDPKALISLAVKANGLTGDGMKPWRLKASLHSFTPSTRLWEEKSMNRKYEELWAGGEKFKQTYSDEEYSQTVYGTPSGKFIAGGLHFVLSDARQLSEFFEPATYLRQYAEGHDAELDPADTAAGESTCLRTVSDRPNNTKREPLVYRFCFDSSLRLVRFSINGNDDLLILFRRPLSFNGRAIPTEVELRRHGIVRMLAHLESLEVAEPIEESELQPPADAVPDETDPPDFAMPTKINVSNVAATRMLIERTQPVYPLVAKSAGIQGTVVLQAKISKEGRIEDLHVVSGPAELQQASIDAVKQWVYKPYLLMGQPVEVMTTVNVIFTLGNPPG